MTSLSGTSLSVPSFSSRQFVVYPPTLVTGSASLLCHFVPITAASVGLGVSGKVLIQVNTGIL